MTRVLKAGRKEPLSGSTRSAVVFLHGYGANGADHQKQIQLFRFPYK